MTRNSAIGTTAAVKCCKTSTAQKLHLKRCNKLNPHKKAKPAIKFENKHFLWKVPTYSNGSAKEDHIKTGPKIHMHQLKNDEYKDN